MKLSTREKYIGYGVGAALALLLLDSILLSPLFARLNDADARVGKANRELQAGTQLVQNSDRALRRWDAISANNVMRDASTAESQLLNNAREWAASAGLSVSSLKPGKADKESGFEKAVVQIAANGTMEQTSRFLYSVQTARIPVRVGEITMTSRKEGTDDLTLQVTLSSIYEPAAATSASPGAGKAGGR